MNSIHSQFAHAIYAFLLTPSMYSWKLSLYSEGCSCSAWINMWGWNNNLHWIRASSVLLPCHVSLLWWTQYKGLKLKVTDERIQIYSLFWRSHDWNTMGLWKCVLIVSLQCIVIHGEGSASHNIVYHKPQHYQRNAAHLQVHGKLWIKTVGIFSYS